MLSQIDENDLKEFLDKDQQQSLETAPSVVLEDEHTDDTESDVSVEETQTDKPDKAATNSGLFIILLLAVAGVAGYYYFKIYKPKKEEDEDDQPEGLETGGLEEIPDEEESEDEDFEENEK